MLGAPPGSSFEVFGVDMLVDNDYRPWLVEINAVPSLARKVSHPVFVGAANAVFPCLTCLQCLQQVHHAA